MCMCEKLETRIAGVNGKAEVETRIAGVNGKSEVETRISGVNEKKRKLRLGKAAKRCEFIIGE